MSSAQKSGDQHYLLVCSQEEMEWVSECLHAYIHRPGLNEHDRNIVKNIVKQAQHILIDTEAATKELFLEEWSGEYCKKKS